MNKTCAYCKGLGGFITNYPGYGQSTCELCYIARIHWFGHAWRLNWIALKHRARLQDSSVLKLFIHWFVHYYLGYY